MPDSTYKWVIYDFGSRLPEIIFQKKYLLKRWLERREDNSNFTIFRFDPSGFERVELDSRTLEPVL